VTAGLLAEPGLRCPGCDLALPTLLAGRRAGCPGCYDAFGAALAPLRPGRRSPPDAERAARWRRARALAAALDEAVLLERFERAARLKRELDRLRAAA
jgi:protein-arginine kinase activator protein McsA